MLLGAAHKFYYLLTYLLGGWWRWALLSPDGVAPSRMVGVSASVNLPLHHKVQKFSSGTGSPGWSRKKGRKTVVCVCMCVCVSLTYLVGCWVVACPMLFTSMVTSQLNLTQSVSPQVFFHHSTTCSEGEPYRTRMWANAQRDGRPAEYRWRPLFNAAKFGWRPVLELCSNTAKARNPLKFAGVPQTRQQISAIIKFTTLSGRVEEVLLFNKFF